MAISRAKVLALTATLAACALAVGPAQAQAQTRPTASATRAPTSIPAIRTRVMASLSGYEIEEYLKRNDVIYVPVGPTEYNGGSPIDVEYVIPMAYAVKLAEKSDGLVFPYLAYFYPGGTTSSPATVMVSPSEGLAYLKVLTRSLIRQGFRRIIYLSSHGPSGATLQPLVREIYDEMHVPVVWMDTGAIHGPESGRPGAAGPGSPPGQNRPAPPARPAGAAGAAGAADDAPPPQARNLTTYGAYSLMGRLSDLPVGLAAPQRQIVPQSAQSQISRYVGGGRVGSFYRDPEEHGGFATAVTAEQREQYARQGVAIIESQVAAFDVMALLEGIRAQAEYTKEVMKKFGDKLPGQDVPAR